MNESILTLIEGRFYSRFFVAGFYYLKEKINVFLASRSSRERIRKTEFSYKKNALKLCERKMTAARFSAMKVLSFVFLAAVLFVNFSFSYIVTPTTLAAFASLIFLCLFLILVLISNRKMTLIHAAA